MAKYTDLNSLFTAIANSIRAKKGTIGKIVADNFPDEIAAIQNGVDLSGVTAEASDVLTPKVFVNSEGKTITGSIPTKTSDDITTSANTVSIPSGYYAKDASKSISTVTQATPVISITSLNTDTETPSVKISASSTQSAGYVTGGTKQSTPTILNALNAKEHTLGSDVIVFPADTYLLGAQTIKAANIGLTFNCYGGNYHHTVVNCHVPGLNTRMPTVISLVTMSLDGALHDGEDGCNGISSLHATVDSDGYLNFGVVRFNNGGIDSLEYLNSTLGNVLQITPYNAETFELRCLDNYLSLYGTYAGIVII